MNLIELLKTHKTKFGQQPKFFRASWSDEESHVKCFTFGSPQEHFLERITAWYIDGGWDFVYMTHEALLADDWEIYQE